jgi:hypothetical protein
MKLNYDEIYKNFVKKLKRIEKKPLFIKDNYLNGVFDILDSISEIHPELLYELHQLGWKIEDLP